MNKNNSLAALALLALIHQAPSLAAQGQSDSKGRESKSREIKGSGCMGIQRLPIEPLQKAPSNTRAAAIEVLLPKN